MSVSAIYTPASGENLEDLSPNEFTAGSELVLQCGVEGNRNSLYFTWHLKESKSCDMDRCATDLSSTTSTLTLDPPLLSYYAGNYTCNVSETGRPDAHNSDEFSVNVVGECLVSL